MRGGGYIGEISVPFTLGVAAGHILASHISIQHEIIAAGAAMQFCAAMLAALPRPHRKQMAMFVVAFMALGLCCSFSNGICAGSSGTSFLARTAGRCLLSLKTLISEIPFRNSDTPALITALITGDRTGLAPELVSAFRDSGASHILALSGLHLGVIYLMVNKMLSVLGNSHAAAGIKSTALVAFSGFYVIMTGAGPSIVRAFLFIILNEIGRLSPERQRDPLRTLLAALTIQLALEPSVIGSLGFQLSYLAMAGIATVYPWMSSWYPGENTGPLKKIWDNTALTVSCQAFTAPLVWLRFRTFPEYFLLTNLLALPLTSAMMSASVVTICLSGMGICPDILVRMTEGLVRALVFVMECISGM